MERDAVSQWGGGTPPFAPPPSPRGDAPDAPPDAAHLQYPPYPRWVDPDAVSIFSRAGSFDGELGAAHAEAAPGAANPADDGHLPPLPTPELLEAQPAEFAARPPSRPGGFYTPARPETPAVNQWTKRLEALAYEMIQQANYQAWIYGQMVPTAKWWADVLSVASAIVSSLVTVESLAQLVRASTSEGHAAKNALLVVTFILSFVATVLIALVAAWQPAETSASSLSTQVKFLQIKRTLTLQLALNRAERHPGQNLMKTIADELAEVHQKAPVAYPRIVKQAERRFGVSFESVPSEVAVSGEVLDLVRNAQTSRPRLSHSAAKPEGPTMPIAIMRSLSPPAAAGAPARRTAVAGGSPPGLAPPAADEAEAPDDAELPPSAITTILTHIGEKECLLGQVVTRPE